MRALTIAEADAVVSLGAIPSNSELQPPYAKEYDLAGSETGARFSQRMDEDLTMRVNTMGTYTLMDAIRRLGKATRVVHASSFFVLGLGFRLSGDPYLPVSLPMDEKTPLEPEDTYSLSKVLGEEILHAFSRAYGIETVAMRLLGVYYHDLEMSRRQHRFGITVPANPDPAKGYPNNTTYQYADARDIARFVALALEADLVSKFEPYFVATDKVQRNHAEVIRKRWQMLDNRDLSMPYRNPRADLDRQSGRELGYKPPFLADRPRQRQCDS
jgi:nucleoside-diphosphate-sugar epimerase